MDASRLILVPLKAELNALIKSLEPQMRLKKGQLGKRRCWHAMDLDATICHGGHGKVEFAIWALHLLGAMPNRKELLVVGTGGSLTNKPVGAVALGRKTVEYDFKSQFSTASTPSFPGCPTLINEMKISPHCFEATILSGDQDITDTKIAQQMHETFHGEVVAWEGAGGARAARFIDCNFLEVRSIVDHSNPDTRKAFQENLELAMAHAADALMTLADN